MAKVHKSADPTIARVHRFYEWVAVHVGNGSTVYLTSESARALGKALLEHADDVDEKTYLHSTLPAVDIEQEVRRG